MNTCGIGFAASIKGEKSYQIIHDALTLLENMSQRIDKDIEPVSGEGAGILCQIPHAFLSAEMKERRVELPQEGRYAVGMLFLPQDEAARAAAERRIEALIREADLELLGWRTVPTDSKAFGPRESALAACPSVRQVFIGRNGSLMDDQSFERKLYVIRKRAELEARDLGRAGEADVYFCSLSSKKIVYKGMLTAGQLRLFYRELNQESFVSALALVQANFAADKIRSWSEAPPFRYSVYDGGLNAAHGHRNRMHSREAVIGGKWHGEDMEQLRPIITERGPAAAMVDQMIEFLHMSGRSLPHAALMMVPEPWSGDESMDTGLKAFYEYHSALMEPWDGPAAMAFTDGARICAMPDRNGLRSARYVVTRDDRILLSSEAGAAQIAEEHILHKGRLRPGRMLLVDTEKGLIIADGEAKAQLAAVEPYRNWLKEQLIDLDELPDAPEMPRASYAALRLRQQAFGYTLEDVHRVLEPMAGGGQEPIASMGYDAPLAVLSERPQRLYNYFKQQFAQVTHPPIDAIREEHLMSTATMIGSERSLISPEPASCRLVKLDTPILSNEQFAKLRHIRRPGFRPSTLPILFRASEGENGLRYALKQICEGADRVIGKGHHLLILSDRGVDKENAAIPALLAVSALHQHLVRQGTRTKASLLLETGESCEAHHFAILLGYGVDVINPYLAFDSIDVMISEGILRGISHEKAVKNLIKAATKGVVKIMSKMGVSTVQAYRGSQLFEALGLREDVIRDYFTGTASRIGGVGLDVIAEETLAHHYRAFAKQDAEDMELDAGGDYQWRKDGEEHLFNPQTIHTLQLAARANDYKLYKQFSSLVQGEGKKHLTLRSLLEFQADGASIPLAEVEPVDSIVRRFKTGAMSLGSISPEAHESLAVAMNRLGGKSNSGEGGEDSARIAPEAEGHSKRSSIKQVASGRFGVTGSYLLSADEIQIKVTQGAKPGEGGYLPGSKIYSWIAEVRSATAGIGLVSPPSQYDCHSAEALAGLIHQLKKANPQARMNVKLVSGSRIGAIAEEVVRSRADAITISGYDGGTAAAPIGSIRHAGLPWELGLAETQQTLTKSKLRERVTIEVDGKMMNGRDVAIAALLGAEEYSFATAPLIVLGCIMMRVCHLDTCPVGIATQNPELRKKFAGDPDHIVNYFRFIAEELREIMAKLGFRTVQEMIGRVDRLAIGQAAGRDQAEAAFALSADTLGKYKLQMLDLAELLHIAEVPRHAVRHFAVAQEHGLEQTLDYRRLIPEAKPVLMNSGLPIKGVEGVFSVSRADKAVGTLLGSEVTRKFGTEGLPEDTIHYQFAGTAGASFGAFIPPGITLSVQGDSNDFFGKGLCGGKLVIAPPKQSMLKAEHNLITGNAALYGATGGEAYICGMAGDRFAVRNSGASSVVEGFGDHGCEYMTGGLVVVLGETGRNFGAGMSGGAAYVWDERGRFLERCNLEMVLLKRLDDEADIAELRQWIERHAAYTGSALANRILNDWQSSLANFVKVTPKEFKRMTEHSHMEDEFGFIGGDALFDDGFETNL